MTNKKSARDWAIFMNINNERFSDVERMTAIEHIAYAPTHNSITKAMMLDVIRYLLTAKQPRVMTLDEVIHSGNDMMWIETKCAKPPHFMLEPTSPYTDNDERWYSVSFQSGHVRSKGLYGRQWRCWTARPTEEQRKAVKWDDISR